MPAPNSSRSLYAYKNQSNFRKQEKARICPDVALPTAVKIRARAAKTPVWCRYSITRKFPRLLRSQACTGSLGALFSAWSDRGATAKVQSSNILGANAPRRGKTHQVCGTPLMGFFFPAPSPRARATLLAVPACLCTTSELFNTVTTTMEV